MITPEIISYIRSQLAAGVSREALTSSLSGQGWMLQDIQEAFNAVSAPIQAPTGSASQPPNLNPAKKGWTIGRVILWLVLIGFVGAIIALASFGYYAYSRITSIPSKICSSSSPTDQANCQQTVRDFFGSLMKNRALDTNSNSDINNPTNDLTSSQTQSGCAGYQNNSGDMTDFTDFVGVSDPLICYYSQATDISSYSTVTLNISGTKNRGSASKIVSDFKSQKVTIYSKDGTSFTLESAATSSLISSQFAGGYIDWFKFEIPFLNLCAKSTGWNTMGDWFTCDKVTMAGVTISNNNPKQNSDVSEIKISEIDTPSGKALDLETRSVKDNQFSAARVIVLREGRLLQSSKSVDISNYTGTDMMNTLSVDQIIAQYPNSSYTDSELSYQK